ncbi:MAG: alpha/beta fold hydrolase [Thermoplasmatota archaeon]
MGRYLDFDVMKIGSSGDDLLFVMGYGNDFGNPGIKWTIEWLESIPFRTRLVRIPTGFTDFRSQVIDPLQKIADDLSDLILISHSFGSLAASYVKGARRNIYIGPYWGVPPHKTSPFLDRIVRFMGRSRISLIPRGFEYPDLGDAAVERDIATVPKTLSFATLNQLLDHLENLPPPRKRDIVYYDPDDRIIDTDAVRNRGIEIREYTGGHCPFTVKDRDRLFKDVLDLISENY